MSRKLANVYLPSKLPGEARQPYKQSELAKDEVVQKEKQVA